MAIGTSFAIRRLRTKDIFCTSPPRVNICGKMELICFDKTGTLTQEGLDVLGFRFTLPIHYSITEPSGSIVKTRLKFSDLNTSIQENDQFAIPAVANRSNSIIHGTIPHPSPLLCSDESMYPLIICAMAACHSIKVVQGELIGDPMDLKMFEFTGWHIEEMGNLIFLIIGNGRNSIPPERVRYGPLGNVITMILSPPESKNSAFSTNVTSHNYSELGIVRTFDFVSGLRRMSVVISRMRNDLMDNTEGLHEFEVFVKGAPEVMRSICTQSSRNSILILVPSDYDDLLKYYTHHGYRVIACAWKKVKNVTYLQMKQTPRNEIESELEFLGFIVFENKLKEGTTSVLRTLNQANIRQVMCTGNVMLIVR